MTLAPRQIHLDFHTSEAIPDIAANFDPRTFAETARKAEASSITVFARCHHGWLYYPSKRFPELIHPNLKNHNLLLEQVRALHDAGIKAPVYITVQWDYHSAQTHPEWLIRKPGGAHEGVPFTEAGFRQSLCVNTGYYNFLAAHTEEVCQLLGKELDGIFFDIVGIRPCSCSACRAEMKRRGIDASNPDEVRKFAKFSIDRFKEKMTALVRKQNPDCTIFYNAGHVGPCTRASRDAYTHFELESLPSGEWGYLHFPVTARYARTLGLDCMGMTGKFHTEWGDFHSLKNQAALEFECFRMLSYGYAVSIGDQLEPYGVLNPAAYQLIGKVFHQLKEREAWARPSKALVEAALVTSEPIPCEHQIPESVFGAVQLLEELALQFDVVDLEAPLDQYSLVILPDDLAVTPEYQRKLKNHRLRQRRTQFGKCLSGLLWRFLSGKGKFMAQFPFAKRAYGERTCGKQRVCDLSSGRAYHTRRRRNPSHTARAVFLPDRRAFLFPPVHSLRKGRRTAGGCPEWKRYCVRASLVYPIPRKCPFLVQTAHIQRH